MMTNLPQRFWDKVDKGDDGCWRWTAHINRDGYGVYAGDDRRVNHAHRFAYVDANGPIPKGLVIDHLCRVRECVNPDHLEPVTDRENVRRGMAPAGINARKTHCIHGHPFDEANTYWWKGHRGCRACNRAMWARKREAKLAEESQR
jgi:hypothetical protein